MSFISFKNNLFFYSIIILFIVQLQNTKCSPHAMKKVSNSLKLINTLSKIAKIKSLDYQIKQKQKEIENPQTLPNTTSSKTKPREMKINSNVIINGDVTAGKIVTDVLRVKDEGMIGNNLHSNDIQTDSINTNAVYVSSITSPTGELIIEGDLIIINEDDDEDEEQIEHNESFAAKEWNILYHDDFDSEESLKGWSHPLTNTCSKGGNAFLGGHCNFSYQEVSKTFLITKPHKQVRITASFHMFDNWNGEYGYMKVNDSIQWLRQGENINNENGINICGNASNDPAFNMQIDVVVPTEENEIKIAFGSTLETAPCNASFGVDDVMIYTK